MEETEREDRKEDRSVSAQSWMEELSRGTQEFQGRRNCSVTPLYLFVEIHRTIHEKE